MFIITTCILFVAAYGFIICLWICNTPKCPRCGKRGDGICIKGGYNRKYKCTRCGRIRRESGTDF